MTTPEQQALITRLRAQGKYEIATWQANELDCWQIRAADCIEALIAEHDALKAEFKIIDEMNDQLREQNTAVDEACAKLEKENDALKAELERVKAERDDWGKRWHQERRKVAELQYPGMTGVVKPQSKELAAIKGAGEPVGHVYTMEPCIPGEHVRYHAQMTAKVPAGTKLYTRPCVPLTDEQIYDFVNDVGLDWQSGWTLDECEPNRYVQLVRAAEAHIKGAKP